MSTPLNELQHRVADHYEGGEFAYVTSVEQAETVGDGLLAFCIVEAGDAGDVGEYVGMLQRAIDQLHSLLDHLGE